MGEKMRLLLFCGFLIICAVLGGSSRDDVLSDLPVRLGALIVIGLSIAAVDRAALDRIRLPLVLLGCLALWMTAQLVPLSPWCWRHLPGREPFVVIAAAAGQSAAWRPISLTPDLTLNALLGLLPPLAALLGSATFSQREQWIVLLITVVGSITSALVGLAQLADVAPYFYSPTNIGDPVGFFANRNHQALLEAITMPLVFLLCARIRRRPGLPAIIPALCYLMIIFLLAELVVAGSRAGLVLGLVGLGATVASTKGRLLEGTAKSSGRLLRSLPMIGSMLCLAALILLAQFTGRGQTISRLLFSDESIDERYTLAPSVWRMTLRMFPVGGGFGSFDSVYRTFQPSSLLSPTYFNHAHNDLLEWAYEGGLPAIILCLILINWIARRAAIALRAPTFSGRELAMLGSIVLVLECIASSVDYPLRTPTLSVMFGLALNWLSIAGKGAGRQRSTDIAP